MGIFNLFGKSKPFNYETKKSLNYKSKNGLLFHEILMLFYAEKYFAGKEPAKFWQYKYDVKDVFKLLKSLEKRGFIENGKLTELGKSEVAEHPHVPYLHNNDSWELDRDKICQDIADYPNKSLWHDVIWGEFNNQLLNAMNKGHFGEYRNIKLSMYQFLYNEKNYINAFARLAEVFYIDLNFFPVPEDEPSYAIAPGLIKDFRILVKKLDFDTQKMEEALLKVFERISPIYQNYSNNEIACIIISLTFEENTIAETIFDMHKK